MNNRITGDFDSSTIDAFRAAYAASMASPEEHDVDPVTNLPSNVISNTSPWLEHTGLWKANDGMSRDFKPNQPFNPRDYFPEDEPESMGEVTEDEETVEDSWYETVEEEEVLSEEEFDMLADEIWDEGEEEVASGDYDYDSEDTSGDEDELNEEEIEELINQILGSDSYDDEEDGDEGYEGEDEESLTE